MIFMEPHCPLRKGILVTLASMFMGMGFLSYAPMGQAKERVALVVGNSGYVHSGDLKNPVHDADALTLSFARLGFQVIQGKDLSKDAMESRLQEFYQELDDAKVAVFFYAGHGLQLNNKNFLVPVGFDPQDEGYLGDRLIVLDGILSEMTRRTPVNLVFLDACRDNPFTDTLSSRMTKGRSVDIGQGRGVRSFGVGLAEVKGSVGTLIAYATQPGNVAMDGIGNNSPFTVGLLEHLETPGLEVRDLLARVRVHVVDETDGIQIPWDHSSLLERFYFKKKRFRAPPPAVIKALFWGTRERRKGFIPHEVVEPFFPIVKEI